MWQKIKRLPLHKKAFAIACSEAVCVLLALSMLGLANLLGVLELNKFIVISTIAIANFASIFLTSAWLKAAETEVIG
jgi:hypothetical protein